MRKEQYRPDDGQTHTNHPDSGYIYLVKNPSSNELSVCAWDSMLYPGISVVMPTRYGLDLGIVVADASQMGKPYQAGSTEIRGACARCRAGYDDGDAEEPVEMVDDQPLAASGEVGPDGNPVVDDIIWNEDPDVDACSECEMCIDQRDPEKVKLAGDAPFPAAISYR